MKYTATVCMILVLNLLSYHGYGQTEKGNLLLGGSMGLASSTRSLIGNEDKSIFVYFNPNISYFLVDKLAIGASIPVSFESNDNAKTNRYAIGPLVRYYFTFEKLALFPEVSYSMGQSKTEYKNGFSEQLDITYTTFRAGLGLTYFINQHVGLEALLYYVKDKLDYGDLEGAFELEITSIVFNIGLQIYLPTKKSDG